MSGVIVALAPQKRIPGRAEAAVKNDRRKHKGRALSGQFAAIPYAVLNDSRFLDTSMRARALLLDLLVQIRFEGRHPKNNGDLQASRDFLRARGWKSNQTTDRAIRELLEASVIIRTKQGGLGIGPNLYAVSWLPINDCGGKLDVPSTSAPPVFWGSRGNGKN